MEKDQKEKLKKKKKIILTITIFLGVLVLLWFILALVEYNRVHDGNKPLICFGDTRELESESEYSVGCVGLFYKYKEYYYRVDDSMSAREFTLFFNPFDRKTQVSK